MKALVPWYDAPAAENGSVLPGWSAAVSALLLYTIATVAMFLPVVLHAWNTFPMDLGDPPNESWLVAWGAHALLTQPAHLLGGNIYYPHANALVYNDSLLGLLPLSVPLYLLSSGNAAFIYNVLFLVSFPLCGLGAYLLAVLLTRSIPGGLLAGLIVAFCPYRMVHLGHLNQLSGQYLLFTLYFWERARRSAAYPGYRRFQLDLAAMGVCFFLQALCSIYYAVFLTTCLVLYLGLQILWLGWERPRRFMLGIAGTAALTGLALLPAMLPYLRLQGRVDTVRGPSQVLYYSADVRDFLRMPPFSVLYGWTGQALGVPVHDAQQYLFPGLICLVLALLGWHTRSTRLEPRIYGVLAVVTALFSLGLHMKLFDRVYVFPMPFALLYDHLPGFHSFRDPARFFFIGFVCLALLAAWGLAALLERKAKWPVWARSLLAAGILLGAGAEYWIRPIPTPAVAVGSAVPPVYHWLKAQPPGTPVLELPIGQQTVAIWSQQGLMTYYATFHWQPIVNGLGGYTPAGYTYDAAILNHWPAPAAVHLLAHWGVRYVIWHARWVGRPGPAGSARIPLVRQWPDGDRVYRVVPG